MNPRILKAACQVLESMQIEPGRRVMRPRTQYCGRKVKVSTPIVSKRGHRRVRGLLLHFCRRCCNNNIAINVIRYVLEIYQVQYLVLTIYISLTTCMRAAEQVCLTAIPASFKPRTTHDRHHCDHNARQASNTARNYDHSRNTCAFTGTDAPHNGERLCSLSYGPYHPDRICS
jgi:hypothetical protein